MITLLKKRKVKKEIKEKIPSSRKIEKQRKKEERLRLKEEKRNLKNEYKKVDKVVVDLLPFLDILEDGSFKTKYGYMNMYQVKTKDLNSLSSNEVESHIVEFATFLRSCTNDIKIVSMKYPVNTEVQQQHLLKKIESTNKDSFFLPFLQKKLDELTKIEELRQNTEFYLFVFYHDEKQKREREKSLIRLNSLAVSLKEIDVNKKIKILFKLNNLNSKI